MNKRIYIAGHKGLVGSAISRQLTAKGFSKIITRSHQELDLLDRKKVFDFFGQKNPHWVGVSLTLTQREDRFGSFKTGRYTAQVA